MAFQKINKILLFAIIGSIALTGCDKAEPTTYKIPKEDRSVSIPKTAPSSVTNESSKAPEKSPAPILKTPASNPPMQVLPGMAEAANEAGKIGYKVPKDWTETAPSGIRKANFTIGKGKKTAEVTVLAFPGDVGGTLGNINRWRQQIGLSPSTEDKLSNFTIPYTIAKHNGILVRLLGPEQGITGGLLPFHNYTWFFKMQGDISIVVEQDANMRAFLDSIQMMDHSH